MTSIITDDFNIVPATGGVRATEPPPPLEIASSALLPSAAMITCRLCNRVSTALLTALLVTLPALTGCDASGGASTSTPGLKDADWIELSSKHVTIVTDMNERRARKVLAELEQRAAVIAQSIFQSDDYPEAKSLAVIFSRLGEYQSARPNATGHLGGRSDKDGVPWMTMYAGGGEPDQFILELWQHSLARVYLETALGPMPKWLHEGLASYYSTARYAEGKISLGANLVRAQYYMGQSWQQNTDPLEVRTLAPSSQAILPSQLLDSTYSEYHRNTSDLRAKETLQVFREQTLYQLSAWNLVHLLMSGQDPFSSIIVKALETAAQGGDTGEAVRAGIQRIGADVVDGAFYEHLARRENMIWSREFIELPEPEISGRAVSAAEVDKIKSQI